MFKCLKCLNEDVAEGERIITQVEYFLRNFCVSILQVYWQKQFPEDGLAD